MTKNENKFFYYSNLIVFAQGALYFYFKEFKMIEKEFGSVAHPWTPHLLHIHVILVPFILVAFGYLLNVHIISKLKLNLSARKFSGISLIVLFCVMTFSGYLLQFGLKLEVSKMIGLIHLVFSTLWFLLLIYHRRTLI